MTGMVSLVGSGPDTDLLTGTARHLIENADVVLHNELLGTEFLESIVDFRDTVGHEPPAFSVIGDVAGSRGRLATFLENGCESGISV